jgi:hypothetical protein
VIFLDNRISEQGRDAEVLAPDSQMRSLLFSMIEAWLDRKEMA